MAAPWAKRFYRSKRWRQVRAAYAESRFWLCEKCGDPGVIVHHRIWLKPSNITDPKVALAWENLQLLCRECHNAHHHRGRGSKGVRVAREGFFFDEAGNLRFQEAPQSAEDGASAGTGEGEGTF